MLQSTRREVADIAIEVFEKRIRLLKDELRPGPFSQALKQINHEKMEYFCNVMKLLLDHLGLEVNRIEEHFEIKPIDKKKK